MPPIHDECINIGQLELLLRDRLDASDEAALLGHIDHCVSCQRSMESLAADRNLWEKLSTCLTRQDPLGADENDATHDHDGDSPDIGVAELIDRLGPTDHPDMLGRIGGYEICGLVGRGGAGIVLKALETSLSRFVAIKVLSPSLSNSGAARKRFEREARAVAAVVHEHVVPIFAVDEHLGLPYFVMQYVTGGSLQHRIERQGPFDPCEVVRISMQVASGVAAAHAQGIVHRDIKPANILLEHGMDRVLVSDFGLARISDGATVTLSGMITGTPSYMAPEQARGEQVDQRSDLFSLGSVMYAMCTAVPPFQSETVYGVIRRICEDEPRSIRATNPEIPEWLEHLILKLLSKNKHDRFDSADQLAAVLSQELAHLQNPTLVQMPGRTWLQPTPKQSVSQPGGRWGRKLAMVACLALAAAVLFASGILSNGTAKREANSKDEQQAATASVSETQTTAGNSGQTLPAAESSVGTQSDEHNGTDNAIVLSSGDPENGEQGVAEALAMAHPIADIEIDGNASDWPEELPYYSIERAEVGDTPGDDGDLTARFRVGHNVEENAIYLCVQVTDDSQVVDAKAGQTMWNAQDGCEVYIDRLHSPAGSPLAQYTRYGGSLNAFGSNEGVKAVDLIVGETPTTEKELADQATPPGTGRFGNGATGRCYEWRIRLEDGVEVGRSIGFDVAVLDKDQDKSFTWLTWGSGAHKLYSPNRRGSIFLVDEHTEFGVLTGQIHKTGAAPHFRPKLRVRALEGPSRWTLVTPNEAGEYATELPVGKYAVEAVDDDDYRSVQAEKVEVMIRQNHAAQAAPLSVAIHRRQNHEVVWQGSGGHFAGDGLVMIDNPSGMSKNNSLAVAFPIQDINVDGDLSDWPDDIEVHTLGPPQYGDDALSKDDAAARFRVGYDREQQVLLVAVEVDDDSFVLCEDSNCDWTSQDGCEVYIDLEHSKIKPQVKQLNFYGNRLEHPSENAVVMTGRTATGRTYEWQIGAPGSFTGARSIGFDLSVLDKDEDGSFSWIAWGQGTQKAWHPQRCGNLLLVDADAQLGAVVGTMKWDDGTDRATPRICLQSLDAPLLRPRVACDEHGNYSAQLPIGKYVLGAMGRTTPQTEVTVSADAESKAELLLLSGDRLAVP